MPRLGVALFNYQNGGLTPTGGYDFAPLAAAFAHLDTPPALILLNEAKRYGDNGSRPLLAAASTLAATLGPPYQARLGWCDRGPYGPALFYDPTILTLQSWGDTHETVSVHQRNIAHLRLCTGTPLRVVLQHWDFASGTRRLDEARAIAHTAEATTPTLLGGDLNSTASGPHLPHTDWHTAPALTRHRKGWQPHGPGTPWEADTRAVDHLIGTWHPHHRERVDGAGLHALAEIAHTQGTPAEHAFRPTTNTGGNQLIDWLLVNDPLKQALIPHTYRVHLPAPHKPPPSDHRLITATLEL